MDEGWVRLHRKIRKHWLYTEKRQFSRYEAWIDMIMTANFTDAKACIDGDTSDVKRGEFITSIKKLCDLWGWSNRKVKTFLDLLQKEGMVVYRCDKKMTFIKLVNLHAQC